MKIFGMFTPTIITEGNFFTKQRKILIKLCLRVYGGLQDSMFLSASFF